MNGLLSESGTTSSTRVATLVLVACVVFTIVYTTVKTGTIPELPIEYVWLLASVFGLKGWQKITEVKGSGQEPK